MKIAVNSRQNIINTGGGGVAGWGCLLFIALPFAAVGSVLFYLSVTMALRAKDAENWPAIKAVIHHLELRESISTKKGRKSKSYRVVADYEYSFEGQRYTSSNVALSNKADNLGSFQQDLYQKLLADRSSPDGIVAYVNPKAPSDSLLNRDLRIDLLLMQLAGGVVFGAMGFGLIAAGLISCLEERKRVQLQAINPGQPWKYREDWAQGYVRNNSRSRMFGAIFIAIIVGGMSLPILMILPREIVKHNMLALAFLIFPSISFGLILWAIRMALVRKKWGGTVLKLEIIPIAPGTELKGTLVLDQFVSEDLSLFTFTLRCDETVRSRRGGKSKSVTNVLYTGDFPGSGRIPSAHGTQIAVRIPVPKGVPGTVDSPTSPIRWSLHVHAQLSGTDLALDYDLPVF